jgi:NAD-reducing hydrogenase large subunit
MSTSSDDPTRLETAADPGRLRRVVIEPLTRVEGHGKVTILLDEAGRVHQVRLHVAEFRGFERFVQGRTYWEIPVLVQRLCGICPVSHHLAAGKAIDMLVGARRLTPSAEKLRRLMHLGQIYQSHALHFFHLASPDLLFGFGAEVSKRNVIGLLAAFPEVALKAVKMRAWGQEVIRAVAGKRVHGVACIPGGVNKPLAPADRETLRRDADTMIAWAKEAVDLARKLFLSNPQFQEKFAVFPSNYLSLVGADGGLDLYDGGLRARDALGRIIFDHVDYSRYGELIDEQVKSWSYMKFPFITALGPEEGWYRVGPLARVNNCDFIPTPLAEAERKEFRAAAGGALQHASLAYHWARTIELLHAGEGIRELLLDPETSGRELVTRGQPAREGVGVVEAPRGTLFHHFKIDEQGLITKANLIVATTHNNQAMNRAVRSVAATYLDGQQLTEGLLNQIEVAIRAYDPCLSCATHALGKMPLHVELVRADGSVIDSLARHGSP